MTKSIASALFILAAVSFMTVGLDVHAELASPDQATLALLVGRDGNGKCCKVGGGGICETAPVVSGCSAPLPWQCYCNDPGHYCQVVWDDPNKHDTCESTGDATEPHCSLWSTYCWTWKAGQCDDDGGPWSWGGFCTTCGCKAGANEQPQPVGERRLCVSGSTGCGPGT